MLGIPLNIYLIVTPAVSKSFRSGIGTSGQMVGRAPGFPPQVVKGRFARSLTNTAGTADSGWGLLVPGSEVTGGYSPHRKNLPGAKGHSGSGLEVVVRNHLFPGVWAPAETELQLSPKTLQLGEVIRISPGTLASEKAIRIHRLGKRCTYKDRFILGWLGFNRTKTMEHPLKNSVSWIETKPDWGQRRST